MYSAKSFRRSSSSARISRLPLQEPNRGCPSTGKGRSAAHPQCVVEMIIAHLIAPRQRRRTVDPSPHLSRFTHNVKDCKPSATGLDVTSRFLLTSSGSLILEPSLGWPARIAFLNPLFSTPRSIFHLSASLDMLP